MKSIIFAIGLFGGIFGTACGGGGSDAGDAAVIDAPLADARLPPPCPGGAVDLGGENYMCGTCTMDHMDGECAAGWLCACNHNCVWWAIDNAGDAGPAGCFFDAGVAP